MKTILAIVAALCCTLPALAQGAAAAPTPGQRDCMNWLSLAARFSPTATQRGEFGALYLRLNRVVAKGTDVVGDASAHEASTSDPAYNAWVMKYDLADDTTRAGMVDAAISRATACGHLIPAPETATATR